MGNIVELNEKKVSSMEEAEEQLRAWRNFYNPTYGWMIVKAGIDSLPDGTFMVFCEARK